MGCNERKKKCRLRKDSRSSRPVIHVFCLASFIIFLLCFSGAVPSTVKGNAYTPAPPQGPHNGFVDIEYQYEIITMDADASWMFDWGDGTTSAWLHLLNATTSILQTHHWTSGGKYSVRVLFRSTTYPAGLWSEPFVVSISPLTKADFPSEPVLVSGCIEGVNGSSYTYAIKATDPHGYRVQYRCEWGDENFSAWATLVSSGSLSTFTHRWDAAGNVSMRFQSLNEYGLHSPWSAPVPVVIRAASKTNQSIKNLILINGIADFLTYRPNHTGVFMNTTSGVSTRTALHGEGTYYLDDDNDGLWDYSYNPEQGLIEPLAAPEYTTKNTQFEVPWLLIYVILGIVVGVIAIVVILVKTGYLYVYEEVVEK
jgi:hypothetical protein